MTTIELSANLGIPESDVLALVDQLIALDGHDSVYVDGHVTSEAAQVVRDQVAG